MGGQNNRNIFEMFYNPEQTTNEPQTLPHGWTNNWVASIEYIGQAKGIT